MPRKIFVTAPDGTNITRQTHREYSHAILVKSAAGTWSAHSWCGRPALAQAKHGQLVRDFPNVEVVMSPVIGEV